MVRQDAPDTYKNRQGETFEDVPLACSYMYTLRVKQIVHYFYGTFFENKK